LEKSTVKTYEGRCADWAGKFATCLDNFEVDPSAKLSDLADRIQADLNLADFKFKFRQADHVHQLLYGPWAISVATFLLAVVVAFVGILEPR